MPGAGAIVSMGDIHWVGPVQDLADRDRSSKGFEGLARPPVVDMQTADAVVARRQGAPIRIRQGVDLVETFESLGGALEVANRVGCPVDAIFGRGSPEENSGEIGLSPHA